VKKIAIILFAVLPLLGCEQVAKQRYQYARNHSKDYLHSFVVAPLEVPPHFAQPTVTENYPVPECLPPLGNLPKVSLVPPGFGTVSEQPQS
jgi:uncharacterized lipoprotein